VVLEGSQLLKDALSMTAAERIALVELLLSSLDSPNSKEIDFLWGRESEDRIQAFENGEIQSIAAKDVFDDVRER
jgi:hypothetical protein